MVCRRVFYEADTPAYFRIGQPLFRDVDTFLAERDFTFHCFTGYGTRSPRGVKVDGSSVNGINQWLWADAFYFIGSMMMNFGVCRIVWLS